MDSKQYTRATVEAFGLWSTTHLQAWRQMLDCAAGTAREGLHLATELQTASVEALQQGQSCILQSLRALPDTPQQPMAFYQKSLSTYLETAEQCYKLSLGNAQVLLRSAEQVGILTQHATTHIQNGYKECMDKLQTLYTPA